MRCRHLYGVPAQPHLRFTMIANERQASSSSSLHAGRSALRTWSMRALQIAAALAWVTAVGIGMQRMWDYETAAGPALPSPHRWPGSALVLPQPGKATLIMFVHPRCTCTPASLQEMQAVVALTTTPVTSWVLLLKPQGIDGEWSTGAVAEVVRRIPNARLLPDKDGIEAARFGAETSGHVVLYDAAGQLRFSGGVTERRGIAGDNQARRAVLAALNGTANGFEERAVLGCGLRDRGRSSS